MVINTKRPFVVAAVLAAAVLNARAVQRVATPTRDCTAEDHAQPVALTGAVLETDYRFTHTSDVESGQISRFSYILRNDHESKLLPAKWVKGGIDFDRIVAKGCGRNDFDYPLGYNPDPNAPVEYGPQAQYVKVAS